MWNSSTVAHWCKTISIHRIHRATSSAFFIWRYLAILYLAAYVGVFGYRTLYIYIYTNCWIYVCIYIYTQICIWHIFVYILFKLTLLLQLLKPPAVLVSTAAIIFERMSIDNMSRDCTNDVHISYIIVRGTYIYILNYHYILIIIIY